MSSTYSSNASLSPEERRVEPGLPEPPRAPQDERPLARYRIHPSARQLFRRGPAEAVATAVIAAGVLMLMQPISMTLYTYSFVTTLIGTALFVVVSKFPE